MSTVGHYPTDVSDAQWEALQLLLPQPKWHPGGPGRKPMDLRRVINGIFYVNKTGCQWRMMPQDIGNGHTIYPTFKGVWSTVANFAPLPRPDTRYGQYPQPHK
jgi:putative transposase